MTRLLLDEGVPRPLATALQRVGVDATYFPNAWKQFSDKALIRQALECGFDVLVTNDRNMPYQQSVTGLPIFVLVLPTPRLHEVMTFVPYIVAALPDLPKGAFTCLARDGGLTRLDDIMRKS